MKLQFALEYRTDWGQDVRVLFKVVRRRGAPVYHVFPLETEDGVRWHGEASVMERDAVDFEYRYGVYGGDAVIRQEWNGVPRRFPWGGDRLFRMVDYWKDVPVVNHVYTGAYRRLVGVVPHVAADLTYFDSTLVLRIDAPQVGVDECVALLGDLPQLGQWEPTRALMLCRGEGHEWFLTLNAAGLQLPFEYKYVVMNRVSGEVRWEGGENRQCGSETGDSELRNSVTPELRKSNVPGGCVQVVWDRPLRLDFDRWKVAGVCAGLEVFDDLHNVTSWAAECGLGVVDVRPLMDESCLFAINPRLVDLRMAALEYHRVGDVALASDALKRFYDNNMEWLKPYAVYCLRRDDEQDADFRHWRALSRYNPKEVDEVMQQRPREVMFYVWLQFDLDRRLNVEADFARSHGVVLMADVSGVVPEVGLMAWMRTGAVALDEGLWWRNAMRRLSGFCDAVRLKGLSEMFGSPVEIDNRRPEGYADMTVAEREAYDGVWREFDRRRREGFWMHEASVHLPGIVESGGMLCCADVAGMDVASASGVLEWLGILPVVEVSAGGCDEVLFCHLEDMRYRSVACVSDLGADMPVWLADVMLARMMFCPGLLCLLPMDVLQGMDAERIREMVGLSGRGTREIGN